MSQHAETALCETSEGVLECKLASYFNCFDKGSEGKKERLINSLTAQD